MCTVTFLPIAKTGFVLTANRDEQTERMPAMQPLFYMIHHTLVVYPKDRQAKGTWIAASAIPFTLCLLNGAFKTHHRKKDYEKSRGLVLLDFFKYNDVNRFLVEYDFQHIEPFTLLLLDSQGEIKLTEVRWDGILLHRKEINTKEPHIWSSATLYSKEAMEERENWFKQFLNKNAEYNAEKILEFHHAGGSNDKNNSLLLNRNEKVKTVSITSIIRQQNNSYMIYKDVINGKIYNRRIC